MVPLISNLTCSPRPREEWMSNFDLELIFEVGNSLFVARLQPRCEPCPAIRFAARRGHSRRAGPSPGTRACGRFALETYAARRLIGQRARIASWTQTRSLARY